MLAHLAMSDEGGASERCQEVRQDFIPHWRGSASGDRGEGGPGGGPQEHRQCPLTGHKGDGEHSGCIEGGGAYTLELMKGVLTVRERCLH